MKKLTTEEFVKRAIEIHGNKYDYSKTEYKGIYNEVCIICPIHGEFWQIPNAHLRGKGCKKCATEKLRLINSKVSTDILIKKAKEIHGNKYDYSKSEYKRRDSKICIICPEHGEFWQSPSKHLVGQECPECNGRNNKAECRLWRKLQEKYPNLNIIHEYHNNSIFGRKSIDIFFEGKNIAIEYQGGEHFIPIKYYGGYKKFIEISNRDLEKYNECKNNNIKLFYFTEEKRYDLTNYIDKVYTKFDDLCSEITKILESWN